MSNDQKDQAKPTAQAANVASRLNELKNVNRIVTNAVNLINDVDIKGAHAGPVTEIIGWLTGFSQSLTGQIQAIESTLPKKEEDKNTDPPKAVEPEKVTAEAKEKSKV